MSFLITTHIAAILGLLLAALGISVMVNRARFKISWGDGNNETLHRAIRGHSNLAEYAPVFLIILGLLETTGTSGSWLYALGGAFIAGRILSAAYFLLSQKFLIRVLAFWATLLPIIAGSVKLLSV